MEREFNYFFDEGTEVTINGDEISKVEFHLVELDEYVGKKGVVKKLYSDFHAFGRGKLYIMDIDFDGTLVENIRANYVDEF